VQIYLDGQPLDFTLEGERTVADVATALERTLATSSLCLTGIAADGAPLPPARWSAVALETVSRLDVSYESLEAARIGALRTTADYLRHFRRALEEANVTLLADLAPGYPSMVESIRTLLAPVPGGDLHAVLLAMDQLLAGNTPERIAAWPPETVFAAVRATDGLAEAVTLKLQESDAPALALPRVRGALLQALSGADEVSVMLLTGRDRQAMSLITSVAELAGSLLGILSRLLPQEGARTALAVAGQPFPAFQAELNGMLGQLLAALAARDTVLIGDLLEYEVSPRLRSLAAAAELPSGR
jgi:hypothetical protein